MRPLALLTTVLLLTAGCLGSSNEDAPREDADARGADAADRLAFTTPVLIDDVRAGGEPVIAATLNNVLLVSSHPGWTHVHPSDDPANPADELLTPASGQSYLWRSTDGGITWTHVGLPAGDAGAGPRGLAPGVSDPDFTITGANAAFHTDLEALASASVSWSTDDGASWVQGNPVASGGPVDRQWLASHEETVYFTANYFTDHRLLASTDGGVTWTRVGDVPCSGDIVAGADGTLYAGCGARVAVSEDGGASWDVRGSEGHDGTGRAMTEPAVDGAGNVWTAWHVDEDTLWLAGSPDRGATWPWVYDVTPFVKDALGNATDVTMVWPWVSAGSAGRVAVTVYASPTPEPSPEGAADRPWSVVTVAALDADDAEGADLAGHRLVDVFHTGPICQSGTMCQVGSMQGDDGSDRRLGDFFESTIDMDGYLHVVYSDTVTKPDDVVSHVGYVRQVGGPLFVTDATVPRQG